MRRTILALAVFVALGAACTSNGRSDASDRDLTKPSSTDPDLPTPAETCREQLAGVHDGDLRAMAREWQVPADGSEEELVAAISEAFPGRYIGNFGGTPPPGAHDAHVASCAEGLRRGLRPG